MTNMTFFAGWSGVSDELPTNSEGGTGCAVIRPYIDSVPSVGTNNSAEGAIRTKNVAIHAHMYYQLGLWTEGLLYLPI